MEQRNARHFRTTYWFTVLVMLTMLCCGCMAQCVSANKKMISCVDRSLKGSEKYALRVDGKPFYMTEIQIRLDKLRYYWNWDEAARDAIVAQAAKDGFNTVSLPIHWYEVEPEKNKFNWMILDEYLALAQKHGLKVELLWFGQNSGGHVQWLGDPAKDPVHLRTPDYVLYSPGPRSAATTSDYTIRRDMSNYSLDLGDKRLEAREVYVLGQVMAHIGSWDAAHGSKHTVIGVQLDNEVRGIHQEFPASLVVSYMSDLGSAVKKSGYVVWTRLNCVYGDTPSRIDANEILRSEAGTNIDFVGIDVYRRHNQTGDTYVADMRTNLPNKGGNYRMITECGAEDMDAAALRLSALAGGTALDYYDMVGPDGHGLYDRKGLQGFVPHGRYIEDVRIENHLLNSDVIDIATKAQGEGLFVHNWLKNSSTPTTNAQGITFIPNIAKDQAITIRHSERELILINTHGGKFTFPASLGITGASRGYFDARNVWVDEGKVEFTKTSITPPPGSVVRLIVVPR